MFREEVPPLHASTARESKLCVPLANGLDLRATYESCAA